MKTFKYTYHKPCIEEDGQVSYEKSITEDMIQGHSAEGVFDYLSDEGITPLSLIRVEDGGSEFKATESVEFASKTGIEKSVVTACTKFAQTIILQYITDITQVSGLAPHTHLDEASLFIKDRLCVGFPLYEGEVIQGVGNALAHLRSILG